MTRIKKKPPLEGEKDVPGHTVSKKSGKLPKKELSEVSGEQKQSKFGKSGKKGDPTNPKGAKPKKLIKPLKRKDIDTELSEKSPKLPKIDMEEASNGKEIKKNKKTNKMDKTVDPLCHKKAKSSNFASGKSKNNSIKDVPEKIEDWNKFKKEKKELRMKRIKARTKDNFDRIQEAKKMGERVRLKTLKEDERNKVINQLHGLLKDHYARFVLAHDTARIVQWLLKYSSKIVVHQISIELLPVAVNMLQSKYGIYCIKRLLKYGEDDVRSSVIDQMKGHAVKLASHTLSAPVIEFAFSTYASPTQKQFLVQEFYGDLYKNSKDPDVKHIRDVYKNNENMKAATLGACKTNIKKVLNKSLLDSGLVQTVLSQYLEECSYDDRAELITELAPHIVVISNSRDGSKAAMQCIWHGTAKDKKVIMKSMKEHLIELSKHEFGHCTVITLLDSVDDTVLLHKIILSELLKNAKDLAVDERGRKVLLWLVAPTDLTVFHPHFIKELTLGRESSNSKKSVEARRQEILSFSINTLLSLFIEDTKFWITTGSLAIEMVALLKAGSGDILNEALSKLVETITNVDWKIQDGENEVLGIEHAGIHLSLKKLAQHDKIALQNDKPTFGAHLLQGLTDDVLNHWLKINRGCFLLVTIFENNDDSAQKQLKRKLKPFLKLLKGETSPGAKILLKKL